MRHLKLVSDQPSMENRAALKLAFASSDRKTVNQHFGAAQAFVVYEVSASDFQLAEVVEFSGQSTVRDGHEAKLDAKIRLLEGCSAVYCNAVGASAIRQLLAAGLQPLKVAEGSGIDEQVELLQQAWATQPPAWLQRSLRQVQRADEDQRFAAMAREGW